MTALRIQAPVPFPDWPRQVPGFPRALRADGARWVVTLLHDGVEWWPAGDAVATRADRLDAVARPWAAHVDLILCGHNFAAWTGELAGTPAGQPHLFATSMVVADLGDDGAVVRGVERVPPVRPARATAATEVLDAAASRIVGELDDRWLIRTGAANYLPDLYAEAFRCATGADAGVVVPNFHGTQAPLDGAIGSLGPGPVTELDLLRPFAALDYDLTVAALRPGELQAAAATQWASADPRNTAADVLHWNWCRMPVGISDPTGRATTAAVIPAVVPCLSEWLGREVEAEPTTFSARDAVAALLSIH